MNAWPDDSRTPGALYRLAFLVAGAFIVGACLAWRAGGWLSYRALCWREGVKRRAWWWALPMALALAALPIACRMPFPLAAGSGQVVYQDTTVLVTVRDCPGAVFTEAVRSEVERAEPVDGLVLVFHRGPSRYLGDGLAEVNCADAQAIPRLAEEHRRDTR
jgi:hypothetical protein